MVTGEGELVEAFNQQFVSVGRKLAEEVGLHQVTTHLNIWKLSDSATLILKPVTNSQVVKSLK